jgi:fatty-acyl-CoA synthase
MSPFSNLPERAHHAHWPAGVPRFLDYPSTTLWQNLEATAARLPHKAAFVFLDQALSYADLHAQSLALASVLAARASFKGERLLLLAQNSPQFAVAYYAALAAGGVVVPVNPMNRAEELKHYVTDPQSKAAVCTSDLLPDLLAANAALSAELRLKRIIVTHYSDAFDPAKTQVPEAWKSWILPRPALPFAEAAALGIELIAWADALQSTVEFAPVRTSADDLVVLPYTSGTTGLPKGCMHSNATIGHNVWAGIAWGGSSDVSVFLGATPMFHITGMLYALHCSIALGATTVLMPRWERETAGRAFGRYGVTHWTNIPTMVIDLMASPNWQQFDLSSLQYIGGGGAAMPQAVAQRLLEDFGLRYVEGYGLTETAAPSHSNPLSRPKQQCLGVPYISTDARVFDPASLPHEPREVPQGESGEICIFGPMVFKGYWQRPEATAAAFFEYEGRSYFRSGDIGRVDEEGYFFMTDRLKRMINASGFKVWPAEVEALLFAHPAIQEACIIATRDSYRGESVMAVVVKRAGHEATTEQAIIDWCRETMALYKAPKHVRFVDALPKSGAGKVLWRVLQEAELK